MVVLIIPLYQFSVTIFCEVLNMYFITQQANSLSLFLNYVAISCITQIDNLYVETIRKFHVKEVLLEDQAELFKHLQFKKYKEVKHDDRIKFFDTKARTLTHDLQIKLIVIIYKLCRIFYKSIYFYFLPLMIVPISYTVYEFKQDI